MLRLLGKLQQPLLGAGSAVAAPFRPEPQPIALPEAAEPVPPTPRDELERQLARLARGGWAALPLRARAAALRACLATAAAAAGPAAALAARHKGSWGAGAGEELLGWAPVLAALREYADALDAVAAGGAPRVAGVRRSADGRRVVDVFPVGIDALAYGGFRGEVWVAPGREASQGACLRRRGGDGPAGGADGGAGAGAGAGGGDGGSTGPVFLVLGAGNQLPALALDLLHVLVAVGRPALLKMNPANEYLGPSVAAALAPLAAAGGLEVAYGGAGAAAFLADHALVGGLALTGSGAAFDALVWRGRDKAPGAPPPYAKPTCAELGNVTPVVVVPGPWSAGDMAYHAAGLATHLAHNAGHNCLALEAVVTDAEWPLRGAFLDALRGALAATPRRAPHYAGAEARMARFRARFPAAEALGPPPEAAAAGGARQQPWLLAVGVAPEDAAVGEETWGAAAQEVALPGCGGDAAAFLEAAVAFCNDRCFGTLACGVLVHPATARAHAAALDAALGGLRYGNITVNAPPIVGFGVTRLPWGAHGGAAAADAAAIGSGNCLAHNTALVDHAEKGVLHAPWRFHPPPFWNATARNMEPTARALLAYSARPGLLTLLGLARQALLA